MENKEKGGSAVELAMVLPLLILAVLGIIEFGFLMYDKAVITNASREGARTGIVFHQPESGTTWGDVLGQIERAANNYGMTHLVSLGDTSSSSVPTVVVQGNCFITGSDLTVTVTYPYTFLVLPNFVTTLTGKIGLSGATVMNCENQ